MIGALALLPAKARFARDAAADAGRTGVFSCRGNEPGKGWAKESEVIPE